MYKLNDEYNYWIESLYMSEQKIQENSPPLQLRNKLIKISRISRQLPEDFFPKTFSQSPQKRRLSTPKEISAEVQEVDKQLNKEKQYLKQIEQISPPRFRWKHSSQTEDIIHKEKIDKVEEERQILISNSKYVKEREMVEGKTIASEREYNVQKYLKSYCESNKSRLNMHLKVNQINIEKKIEEKLNHQKDGSKSTIKTTRIVKSERKSRDRLASIDKMSSSKRQNSQNTKCVNIQDNRKSISRQKIKEVRLSLKELTRGFNKKDKGEEKRLKQRYEKPVSMNVGFDGMLTFCGQMGLKQIPCFKN